jgi:hypothetical protein
MLGLSAACAGIAAHISAAAPVSAVRSELQSLLRIISISFHWMLHACLVLLLERENLLPIVRYADDNPAVGLRVVVW